MAWRSKRPKLPCRFSPKPVWVWFREKGMRNAEMPGILNRKLKPNLRFFYLNYRKHPHPHRKNTNHFLANRGGWSKSSMFFLFYSRLCKTVENVFSNNELSGMVKVKRPKGKRIILNRCWRLEEGGRDAKANG